MEGFLGMNAALSAAQVLCYDPSTELPAAPLAPRVRMDTGKQMSLALPTQIAEKISQVFQCGVCSKQFPSKSNAQRHLKTHEPQRQSLEVRKQSYKHACPICNRLFSTPSNVNRHMSVHTGVKRFECERCKQRFTQKEHYKRHLAKNSCFKYTRVSKPIKKGTRAEMLMHCPICVRDFSTPSNLYSHLSTHDQQLVKQHFTFYPCDVCGKNFYSTRSLQLHQNTHKAIECRICQKQFKQKTDLGDHMRIVHGYVKPFQCTYPGCEQAFDHEAWMKTHLKSHMEKRNLPCEKCNRVFLHEKTRKRHMFQVHGTDVPDFKCTVCGDLFFSRKTLYTHNLKHLSQDDLDCQVCGKKFGARKDMKDHALGSTCGIHAFKHKCTIEKCKKFFFSKEALEKHLKLHEQAQNKKFACKKCDAVFSCYISLHTHRQTQGHFSSEVRWPNGPKSNRKYSIRHHFQCSVCLQRFVSQSGLENHSRSHLDAGGAVETYSCRQCGESFVEKILLMDHIRLEHAMAYVCHVCGERFKKQDEVGAHMAVSH